MNDNIIKPANPSEIQSQHSHGPDIARAEIQYINGRVPSFSS